MDAATLLQQLIRCPSVTPAEGGAITLLENILSARGFECHRLVFTDNDTPDIVNLYARFGHGGKHICFAGHTDVVPVGSADSWTHDPFGGDIRDGFICGRGASDMKSGVAAGIAAAFDYLAETGRDDISISFLITGDEEASGINGTPKILEWMDARGEKPDFCILGEPTALKKSGDMIKTGRRGTLTGHLTVTGTQGHVAYPHLADNPAPKLVALLHALDRAVLDHGSDRFQPSNLEIVNINIDNAATNVIPEKATAAFNVRFNDSFSGDGLEKHLRGILDATHIAYDLRVDCGGESFYTDAPAYTDMVVAAIEQATGATPVISTNGGTSDARFIHHYFPVIEVGASGATMHKVDEKIAIDDLEQLTSIYTGILRRFFAA